VAGREREERKAPKKKKAKILGFHDEFMQMYDQFSQSWRDQINRQHGPPADAAPK